MSKLKSQFIVLTAAIISFILIIVTQNIIMKKEGVYIPVLESYIAENMAQSIKLNSTLLSEFNSTFTSLCSQYGLLCYYINESVIVVLSKNAKIVRYTN